MEKEVEKPDIYEFEECEEARIEGTREIVEWIQEQIDKKDQRELMRDIIVGKM